MLKQLSLASELLTGDTRTAMQSAAFHRLSKKKAEEEEMGRGRNSSNSSRIWHFRHQYNLVQATVWIISEAS